MTDTVKKNTRGGKRPGAGRPRKNPPPVATDQIFGDAESYLMAVVAGTVEADPVRVQAAKALIGYQRVKVRAKPKSPTPKKINELEEREASVAIISDFETKAAAIRAKHERGK